MSIIVQTARGIMAALQPLTGTRASGDVLVKAVQATVALPRNSYAIPVIEGQSRPDLAMKAAVGPNADGSWTITSAGITVEMFSNIGGTRQCIPKDTVLAFDPPIAGIKSAIAAELFVGGADLTTYGALRDLVMYEHLDGSMQLDLARSSIKRFPAALLSWIDDEPADGSSTSMTERATRLGTRKLLYKLGFQIAVLSERGENDHARRAEGLEVLDQIATMLVDRNSIDEQAISNPSGLQIVKRWRETGGGPVYQRFYVYGLLLNAMAVLNRTDTRVYQPWVTTIMDVDKRIEDASDLRLVHDVAIEMEQD